MGIERFHRWPAGKQDEESWFQAAFINTQSRRTLVLIPAEPLITWLLYFHFQISSKSIPYFRKLCPIYIPSSAYPSFTVTLPGCEPCCWLLEKQALQSWELLSRFFRHERHGCMHIYFQQCQGGMWLSTLPLQGHLAPRPTQTSAQVHGLACNFQENFMSPSWIPESCVGFGLGLECGRLQFDHPKTISSLPFLDARKSNTHLPACLPTMADHATILQGKKPGERTWSCPFPFPPTFKQTQNLQLPIHLTTMGRVTDSWYPGDVNLIIIQELH